MSGNSKQDQRKARARRADLSIAPLVDRFKPYRLASGDQTRIYDWMDGFRIIYATWYDGGRLTDFALMLQAEPVRADDDWMDAIRIDCCHDEVHMHRITPDGEAVYRVLRPIYTQQDVVDGLDEADPLIYGAEETVRQWRRERER